MSIGLTGEAAERREGLGGQRSCWRGACAWVLLGILIGPVAFADAVLSLQASSGLQGTNAILTVNVVDSPVASGFSAEIILPGQGRAPVSGAQA